MTAAMKAGDKGRLGVIRLINAAIKQKEVDERIDLDDAQVIAVLKVSAPLALGAAVYQVNVMVDGFMALGMLGTGGASVLYYATRVQQFPMSLVSIAATSAVFPALTALGHRRDLASLRSLHDRTQHAIAFVAIPASIGLLFFTEPIVSVKMTPSMKLPPICREPILFGTRRVDDVKLSPILRFPRTEPKMMISASSMLPFTMKSRTLPQSLTSLPRDPGA